MKYKRLIIILSSIFAFVVLCTILSFTLFRATNISFDFKNQTTIFASTEKQNEVIKSGKINTGIPIFSLNKRQIVDNLKRKNPYLKVINIETQFPNKLILHCAEREELFCIKSRDDLYYYCDEDLKILNISRTSNIMQDNAVYLEGVDILNTGATVGEILDFYKGEDIVSKILNAFSYSNKNATDVKAMLKNIELKYENNFYTCGIEPTLVFTTYDDFNIEIRNAKSFLKTKINLMLNIVPQKPEYYSTHKLVIDINPNKTDEVYCVLEKLYFY